MTAISLFEFYSIGIAAENKPTDTRILNCSPIQQLAALDGELTFNPQDILSVGHDSDGNRYEVKATLDVTISTEWLPRSSNRLTPPDIRRGELVEIYRLADTDQFFWVPMGLKDDLRRLETVIYAFNANPNLENTGSTYDNHYFLEISTHRKLVTFSTSKVNGEPFRYTVQFNTGEGLITLADDTGNYVQLDSQEHSIRAENVEESHVLIDKNRILLQNGKGSYLDINENTIGIQAAEEITLTVGGTKVALTPEALDLITTALTMTASTIDANQG